MPFNYYEVRMVTHIYHLLSSAMQGCLSDWIHEVSEYIFHQFRLDYGVIFIHEFIIHICTYALGIRIPKNTRNIFM